jgi:antitoxin MazE
MIRRLFKTGNSIVLSLPKEVLETLHLADGEKISLELDRDQHRLILTPVKKTASVPGVDEKFALQVDEFIQMYRSALEELAK